MTHTTEELERLMREATDTSVMDGDTMERWVRDVSTALPELVALRKENERLREALEVIFAERPAITNGLSQFQWECIRAIARAALNQEAGS